MSDLARKIAKLRSKIGKVSKNKENPFFHSQYFDINKLLEQLQPLLEELNLNLTQPLSRNTVSSIIEDLDGEESIESSLELPDIQDPQKMGSAITYYRRYTLKSLLAIQEEDDDGNKASKGKSSKEDKKWLNKTEYNSDKLTEDWLKVVKRLQKKPSDLSKIYKHYSVNKENRKELESIASKNGSA